MTQTYRVCIVPGCQSTSANRPDLSFHIFPKSRESSLIWLRNLNLLELKDKPYSWLHNKYICGDHFTKSQFSYPGSGKLNRNAVPKSVHECQVHIDFNMSSVLRQTPVIIEPVAGPSYIEMDNWSPPEIIEDSMDALDVVQITTITERLREKDVRRLADKESRVFIVKKVIPLIRERQMSTEALFKSRDLSEIQCDRLYKYLSKICQMSKRIQLFFDTQIKKLPKNKIVRQFSTNEKTFLLALNCQNPSVYSYISKLFGLPPVRLLNKAVLYINQKAGIDEYRFWYLKEASERKTLEDRYCVLLFGDMPLRPHLSYNVKEDIVEGLEDFGHGRGCRIANSSFVFMIRGLAQRWKQTVAFYFVQTSTKIEALKLCILQVVKAIHTKTKFRIVASVSDMNYASRAAVSSLCESYGETEEFIYNIDGHDIIHIFDVPHILKSIRNSLLKRDIIYDEERQAKWSDINLAYEAHAGIPFGNVTKLTRAHIEPEGNERFKVNLASQVFSRSTYTFLMYGSNLSGIMQAHDTADFVLFINDLFDSLNAEWKKTGRLTQPLSDKSPHIKFWDEAITKVQTWTLLTEDEDKVAPFAVKFIILTLLNVKQLWYRLKKLGFKFLQTKLLTQDPLENLFGVIRALCQSKRKPTCSQFLTAYHLAVMNTALQASSDSNCENDGDAYLLPLQTYLISPGGKPAEFIQCHKPIYDKHFCTLITKIKLQTNSYIAGFVCRNILHHNCSRCVESFLSSKCTDCHTSILFRDKNSDTVRLYPKSTLISEIEAMKLQMWDIIAQNLSAEHILSEICNIIAIKGHDVCEEHSEDFYKSIVLILGYIMLKNFLLRLNEKLIRKDTRPIKVIDDYLAVNGLI